MPARQFLPLADLLPEAMLLVNGDGAVVSGNRSAAERLGLSKEILSSRSLFDLVAEPREDVSLFLRECARSRQLIPGSLTLLTPQGPFACRSEGAVLRPRTDGEPALVLLRCIPRETALQRFLLLNERMEQLHREIARRKRMEQDLRDQREWLRVTLGSIGDAVIATDTEGRVSFMNPVAQELTGWTEAEAAGRPLAEVFPIVNEETRHPVESPVARVLREGVVVGLANHTVLISRDGRELPIDDSASPIRSESGEVLGVVLIFHDIVDRRNLERELRQKADRLAEADRRKDEFLAMLSHELRNPLAPVRNALHILGTPDASGPMLLRAREMMERQIRHMVRLVDDLLDVSRITRGKVHLRRETIDLTELAVRAGEVARPLIEAAGQRLEVSVPSEPLFVDADPTRMDQVLANLLNNATKFTEPGGRIRLSVEAEDGVVAVRVRDTGIGIPADLLPQVFEPFVQSSRALDRSQGGLGIGLTLVSSLVEMHGGSVEAYSEGLGQGSEFVVRLPRLAAPAAGREEREPGSAPAPAPVPRRVLVVDDNQDATESLSMLLDLWGYEVRVAHDGIEAIGEAAVFHPDVVLLDIGLPGLDGYEVARRLREEPGPGRMVLVAMTGYGQESDRQRAFEAGFDHHMVKPVDPGKLRQLLEETR